MRRVAARLRRSTFALPALIGAASAFGLVAALLGDGAWHVAAWAALACPVLAVLPILRRG